MKITVFILSLFIALLPSTLFAQASNSPSYVVLNRDYTKYDTPKITSSTPGQIEVIYFFWYGSSWSNEIDKDLTQWINSNPHSIKLTRSPVIFDYDNPHQILSARIFFALERLGLEKALGPLFMEAVHNKNVNISSMKSIISWFSARGVSEEEFLSAINHDSSIVKTHALRHTMENYKIKSSPTIVIDGTYQIRSHEKNTPKRSLETAKFMITRILED